MFSGWTPDKKKRLAGKCHDQQVAQRIKSLKFHPKNTLIKLLGHKGISIRNPERETNERLAELIAVDEYEGWIIA